MCWLMYSFPVACYYFIYQHLKFIRNIGYHKVNTVLCPEYLSEWQKLKTVEQRTGRGLGEVSQCFPWASRQDGTVAKQVLTDICLTGFKRKVMEMVTFPEPICSSVLLSLLWKCFLMFHLSIFHWYLNSLLFVLPHKKLSVAEYLI